MPFTPYHIGPNGFLGLQLRKYLDLPALILANVAIDLEVLIIREFHLGYPIHRYCHTLLIGCAVGALMGLILWLIRPLPKLAMRLLRLPYQPTRLKMVFSGALGAALHILVDGLYHHDVKVFWPSNYRLWIKAIQRITQQDVRNACLILIVGALVEYALILVKRARSSRKTD